MSNLPMFLRSFDDLKAHFESHFGDMGSAEKGDAFVRFAERIIPFTDVGRKFEGLERNPRVSHDKGVDLFTATNEAGDQLCVQSKYTITRKADFDSIVSAFHSYEQELVGDEPQAQTSLFLDDDDHDPTLVFMVITTSKLDIVLDAYEKSRLTSRPYYDALRAQHRLHIVHGPDLLRIMQGLYQHTYLGPPSVALEATEGWTQHGSVRLGTVAGRDLARLYAENGDGLFFENIRTFLGGASVTKEDRVTVNERIIDTILNEPARMLERNNGIVIKASKVTPTEDGSLQLEGAAIVNGCQTTVCLYECKDNIKDTCLVSVKVVETDEGWDIAHAANYQNEVKYIDLELARWLRPQLVERAASDSGFAVEGYRGAGSDVNRILTEVHQRHVEYEEVRQVYIGLFSRSPKDLFQHNYSKLRGDVLEEVYGHEETERTIYSTIFDAVAAGRDSQEQVERNYDKDIVTIFKRLGDKSTYRAYLVVLSLCGALRQSVAAREGDPDAEAARMRSFLDDARALLDNDRERFLRVYRHAYAVLAELAMQVWEDGASPEKVQQHMASKVKGSAFEAVYASLRMRIDNDPTLSVEDMAHG